MRAVELPASVDERVDGQERVAVGASGERAGKVVVRALPVRLGQSGSEGGDEPLTELTPAFSQVR